MWLRGVKYTFVTAIQVAAYVTSAQPGPKSSRQPHG